MKKTTRKVERDLIEETAKIYHSVVHDSMDGFCIVDMWGRFLDVNDIYCRLIGYSRSELLKMNKFDVDVKGKPQGLVKQLKQIKKAGKSRFFTEHRKKNGTIIDVEISASYANYLGGLVFISLRDITAIKKTENDQYRNRAASRKKIEGQLADSYEHSKDQAKSRKVIEGQLADSEGQLADSYEHSENQAKSRKVIMGQLADSYEHSKDQAKSRKIIEGQLADSAGQLADSYEHSENQAKSRKVIEGQLADSYQYLGTINRKISILLELERFPKSKRHNQKVVDHVLNMAMSIVNASLGYLYSSKGRGEFHLLSYKGVEAGQEEKIKVISSRKVGLLKHLLKEKSLISGDVGQHETGLLAQDSKLEDFVILPLSKEAALGGFIFLGFDKKHSMSTQDLEFLDVFAMHASKALIEAGVLE